MHVEKIRGDNDPPSNTKARLDSKVLVELWRQSRSTVDHIDDKMNELRVAVFTLFGTLTTVAAALMFWAPQVFLASIRLSALVELALILVLIPLIVQNRLYHLWLFRFIVVTLNLEDTIYDSLEPKPAMSKGQLLLTYGVTQLEGPPADYWKTMKKSKLFWSDVVMFALPLFLAVILALAFQAGPARVDP